VRFGVHLPLMDFGDQRVAVEHLVEYAESATGLGFDSVSADDHMVFGVPWLDGPLPWRRLTAERINAGLDEARARGQQLGRPAAMMPAKRRAVADMLARGESRAEIAHAIGVSRATLYRHLAELRATA
jgi:Helix-turn-helix domain of resolvase